MKKLLIVLFCLAPCCIMAQDVVSSANTFLALLDEKQKAKASYVLSDVERVNWHFIPRGRNGLPFKSMSPAQREGALKLLRVSLSEKGYGKANSVMDNENALRLVENRGPDDTHRDPLNYYVTIFGTPSVDRPWGWRLEGHHLALNFSFNKKEMVSATPTFWGSNPAIVQLGPEKGKQLLKLETNMGYELTNSFTDAQKKIAIIDEKAPSEIITGNSRKAQELSPPGLSYSAMTEDQQKLFSRLLDLYIQNYEKSFSTNLMDKISKSGIKNLSFAWAGSLKLGEGHYYRIQGPTLLIEYDNTQNNANHVHAVVRDLTNDFADDVLKDHYLKEHQN